MDIAKEMDESLPYPQALTLAQRGAWIGGMKVILFALFVGLLMVGCGAITLE